MLNQKDNDVDDLFRRASDKYPLRTDSADWDKMAAALDNSPPDLPYETMDTGRRRKRRFFWLLLLLPLAGIGYYAERQAGIGHGTGAALSTQAPAGSTTSPAAQTTSPANPTAGTRSSDGSTPSSVDSGTVADASTMPGQGQATSTQSSNARAQPSATSTKPSTATTKPTAAPARLSPAITATQSSVAVRSVTKPNRPTRSAGSKPRRGTRNGIAGEDAFSAAAVDSKNEILNTSNADNAAKDSRVAGFPIARAPTAGAYTLTVNVEAPSIPNDSSKPKPKTSPKQKERFLYVGLLGAADYSTVKFQSSKSVGTTFGVLLGYQFNKKWAVETGLYMDRKRYYTDAEYFDTKKLPAGAVQPNWKLNNMDGTCYMWEIPLNIRYNFSQTEKSKWFATAGLSTYLMTREDYDYNYDWWNGTSSGNITKNWDWRKPSQYWFSIVNLSVGYEHRLGGIGNLRVEPYLRVPLSGLGTGKLNIVSSGINIGITRRLW